MQTELRAGWADEDDARQTGRACSVYGCDKASVTVERRRTEGMSATGFYPMCAIHLELPSARAALLAGVAVRNGEKRGWAIYPTTYETYDLYPGDEGPQRDLSLAEALRAVGGDQACRLAPAGVIKWPTLDENVRTGVLGASATDWEHLGAECQPNVVTRASALDALERLVPAIREVVRLVEDGKLSAAEARPVLVALENARHGALLESL